MMWSFVINQFLPSGPVELGGRLGYLPPPPPPKKNIQILAELESKPNLSKALVLLIPPRIFRPSAGSNIDRGDWCLVSERITNFVFFYDLCWKVFKFKMFELFQNNSSHQICPNSNTYLVQSGISWFMISSQWNTFQQSHKFRKSLRDVPNQFSESPCNFIRERSLITSTIRVGRGVQDSPKNWT